jgi:hypothetical protein
MRDRRDWVIAAMAAALLFGAGILFGGSLNGGSGDGLLPTAQAQDDGSATGGRAGNPNTNGPGGVTVQRDPLAGLKNRITTSGATASDSNSNNRMVAVTTPIGSGESVLFLIDTKTEQLTVYKFDRNKGLKFIAARKIDYDLRINGYEDMSEFSREDLKREYHKQVSREAAKSVKNKGAAKK